ncbi:hypothetical protein BCR33DRAFT_851260 [Rhizoclosmatium globosum]|uniref:Activator of Hsp90 ATPase AHSA1-like N-terminal domain-containing protein n=1 Tax=Rhizoclosmatium globosum TaxID=329046 RepID=A0A1Y2C7N1_9FUNG|nr:hypothetical protein BCR33DRAFT_851260 [Rhizoclosmatium globosum]|eukprot:ORY43030.1 hypothetical protein BCR33DRAFT_851260 [Rhizoclosmatium globosum]
MSVNHGNWHWIERNCLKWAQTHLKRSIMLIDPKESNGMTVTSVVSIEGQADINQRKGKLITVFDLQFVVTWKGTDLGGQPACGQISVVDFMHDTDLDELEYFINVDNKAQQQSASKQVETQLIPKIKAILSTFSQDMLNENSKNLLNDSGSAPSSPQPVHKAATAQAVTPKSPTTSSSSLTSPTSPPKKVRTTTVNLESQFLCTASDLYDTLLNPARVRVWSKDSKTDFVAKKGEPYILFSGAVSGTFVDLVPCSKITKKWKVKGWAEASTVTITIDEFDDVGCKMGVVIRGVPVDEEGVVKRNWEGYYFEPIRGALERCKDIPKVTPVVSGKKGSSDGWRGWDAGKGKGVESGGLSVYAKAAVVVVVVAILVATIAGSRL